MVLETPFPPDIRVEKEARALHMGSHDLFLLCGQKEGQPLEEKSPHFRISRFNEAFSGKVSKAAALLHYWLTTRKKLWEREIDRFVEANDLEALHVHDLPLVPTGVAVARRHRIPLVFDMHEIYPVMIRGKTGTPTGFIRKVNSAIHSALFSPGWWDQVETRSIAEADRIIVVIDESKDRLERMGIEPDKVAVVLNAEDIDSFLAIPAQTGIIDRKNGDFLVGYVGGVDNPNRGLDNLVKAWPSLLERMPNAHLIIVGDGPMRLAVEETVRQLALSESVRLVGRVPFNEVPAYIRAFDVAVIPHIINEHTNHTIPHKLFQYIALGKIVVASDIVPIRRILQDTGAGVIVDEWSPRGFADAIVSAHERLRSGTHNPEEQEAILRAKYGYEAVSEPLLNLYRGLEKA